MNCGRRRAGGWTWGTGRGRLQRITRRRREPEASDVFAGDRFAAEAAYAGSIVRLAVGDIAGSIEAIEQSLQIKPDYAPAILSLGSVEYQRGRRADGKRLFMSLLSLPDDTDDLAEIIDEAGTFLIQSRQYADGLDLYRAAANRFPEEVELHSGVGCCAGHLVLFDETVSAGEQAVRLKPEDATCASDLGWSLFEAGRYQEARGVLERAAALDPSNELAQENLRHCRETVAGAD